MFLTWTISLFNTLDLPRKDRAILTDGAFNLLRILYIKKEKVSAEEFCAIAQYKDFITDSINDDRFTYLLDGGFIRYNNDINNKDSYYVYITISGKEFYELSTRETVRRYKDIFFWLMSGLVLFFSYK